MSRQYKLTFIQTGGESEKQIGEPQIFQTGREAEKHIDAAFECSEQHIDEVGPLICQECGAGETDHNTGEDNATCPEFVAWLNPPEIRTEHGYLIERMKEERLESEFWRMEGDSVLNGGYNLMEF